MGKYDEAIKTAKIIVDIAERAKLYSVVKEENELITTLYTQAKSDQNFIALRGDFEKLIKGYEALVAQEKLVEAHDLVQNFKHYYEREMKLNSFERVKDLFIEDERRWIRFQKNQKNLIKQLDPLEIQFNSYINTNNLLLAGEALKKARKLLDVLKDSKNLKKWEMYEATYLELKKNYDLNEDIELNIKKVSKLTDNYEFDEARSILESKIELLQKSDFSDYIQKLKSKLKYVVDAESKYLKLVEDIKELEGRINLNISQNQFREAIDNINQIIKISRFIGKTDQLDEYSGYIEILEKKINKISEIAETSNLVRKYNIQGIEALKKENFDESLKIFKKIVGIIKTLNQN
jgi:hypothetical protein